MNKLAMKNLCGSLLLSCLASGAALAQQPYGSGIPSGTDSTSGASPGGAMPGGDQSGASGAGVPAPSGGTSGMGGMPSVDQTDPMTGGAESGASGTSGSGAAAMAEGGSEMTSEALAPEIPGAAGPSDADPFKAMSGESTAPGGMRSR
jgi:hypothetical protein